MLNKNVRVLMIPDGFGFKFSGYATAVCAAEMIGKMGIPLGVYAEANDEQASFTNIEFFDRKKPFSTRNIIFSRSDKDEYSKVLDTFKPTHIFIIGVGINKYPFYYDLAYKRGIKMTALWLVSDFFCFKNWAVRDNMPCRDCLPNNLKQCIKHDCSPETIGLQPQGLKRRLRQYQGIWLRQQNRQRMLKMHKILGSSDSQLDMYRIYGMTAEQVLKCPFFYDSRRLDGISASKGDYFIFMGQYSMTKGWTLISKIMDLCPDIKFVSPFFDENDAIKVIEKFGFQKHIDRGQLRIVSGVRWGTGAEKLLADSYGVINPSLWETTTESVLMEALGLGKPIVTFNIGIHNEIFKNGENGWTVPVGNLEAFAEGIYALKNMSDSDYVNVSKNARLIFDQITDEAGYKKSLEKAFA
jgi:glycosyltransferase involved in cell wall biosynthesis